MRSLDTLGSGVLQKSRINDPNTDMRSSINTQPPPSSLLLSPSCHKLRQFCQDRVQWDIEPTRQYLPEMFTPPKPTLRKIFADLHLVNTIEFKPRACPNLLST